MQREYAGFGPLSERQQTRKLINGVRETLKLCAAAHAGRIPWMAVCDGALAAVLGTAVGVIVVLI